VAAKDEAEAESRSDLSRRWRRVLIGTRRLERRLARLSAQFKLPENTIVLATAAVIGLLAGAGALVLNALIFAIQRVGYGVTSPSVAFLAELPWWLKLALPASGGLLVGWIVSTFAPEAKGHGVPEVMEAVAVRGGLIRKRVSISKAIASALTIGTGGATGREGPIIQIGGAIGSTIGRYVGLNPQRVKVYVACGAAAGIAAAFNAPLAGAIFAAEVILADFAVPRLGPVVVASVAATALTRAWSGDERAFTVPAYEFQSVFEFLPYLVLGALCGLMALTFIRLLYHLEDRFDAVPIHRILRPALGGLLIGALSLIAPGILGIGYEEISRALNSEGTWYFLLGLAGAKLLATSITLGSGGSGGIFAPSLFLGATLGGAFGHVVHALFPGQTASPGAYALVGMGGVVAGATHAPITAILILFEMTGSYKIILPLMFTCVGSVLLSSRLHKNSIYTEKLARKGLDLWSGRETNVLRAHKVGEVIREDAETVSPRTPMNTLINRVVESPHDQFFVKDDEGRLMGVIHAAELRRAFFDRNVAPLVIAQDLVEPCTTHLYPDDSLDQAMRLFGQSSQEEIPVVEKSRPDHLLGIVTHADCIRAYNRAVARLDAAGEIALSSHILGRVSEVSVSERFRLLELEVPARFHGKTLLHLELPRTYGVQVLLVRRKTDPKEEMHAIPPRAGLTLQPGDRLVIAGTPEAVAAFRSL
jgi:CIC family chloride channel protein